MSKAAWIMLKMLFLSQLRQSMKAIYNIDVSVRYFLLETLSKYICNKIFSFQ